MKTESQEKFIIITKEEMDNFFFSTNKGWIRNISGNEYVYDFHMKYPYPLVIKVMSSISVYTNKARNKGSDAIRVFVIKKDGFDINSKVKGGFLKSKRVYRTINWKDNLKSLVLEMFYESRKIYMERLENEYRTTGKTC